MPFGKKIRILKSSIYLKLGFFYYKKGGGNNLPYEIDYFYKKK